MFRQKGLSLIELMISIAVGLVLMTGVVQLFLGSRVTFETQQAVSRVQETGRMAIEFMAQDIRMAGYRGCSQNVEPVSNLEASTDYNYDFGFGNEIEGFSAGGTETHPLGAGVTPVAGSDILVIRSSGEDSVSIINKVPNNANFDVPGASNNECITGQDICEGDVVMLSDCSQAAIFRIANIASNNPINVVHSNANFPSGPRNMSPQLPMEFGSGAEIVKMVTSTYYVAPSTVNPGQTSLWKRQFGDSFELVEGVETMRLRYGEDTSGNGVPDTYRRHNVVSDWSRVGAVRIELLVRSETDGVLEEPQPYVFDGADVTPTDRRLRHVFINTIAVRNRLQ
ncbi:PilW family protein [Marinimicrobium alkaliphilum]|uniref:PilW family protein n=1 Tax=Marinimicrobium alkaliphilum TaxID=2202654 RepID=UPI0018E0A400|nr:PilW family protein [Marinimicrobium alkaliphilum]